MQEDNLLTQTAPTPADQKPDTKQHQTVPDKFWDKDKQEIRIEALLKSYLELEKKLSGQKQKQALPPTPHDYALNLDHALFTVDDEINAKLFQAGFTQEQVQLVYDLAAEKMVPLIVELAQDFEADREMEKLVKAFGGPEKWAQVSKQLLSYGQQHLPADVLSGLAGSYEGVMALYRLMQAGKPFNLQDTKQDSASVDEQGLKKMMQDPKYWRDKDSDIVNKVTAGFKQIFNS
jgi:hypothetical protein